MRIPVFVSCPTTLNDQQRESRKVVVDLIEHYGMEPRALGFSDYPKDLPLREVLAIAKHCHGGVILGFEQLRVTQGIWKPGALPVKEAKVKKPFSLPTPWNQLETGILFGWRLPLLIFREENVGGGVFDVGTSEAFVH